MSAPRAPSTFHDLPWAPLPNRAQLDLDDPERELSPITAVSAIVLSQGHLLLTHVDSRGWDLPGGHRDPGESSQEALLREVIEETGVRLPAESVRILAALRLRVLADKPEGYRYPWPDSTQLVCFVELSEQIEPAPEPSMECSEARWVAIPHALELARGRVWEAALHAALGY